MSLNYCAAFENIALSTVDLTRVEEVAHYVWTSSGVHRQLAMPW